MLFPEQVNHCEIFTKYGLRELNDHSFGLTVCNYATFKFADIMDVDVDVSRKIAKITYNDHSQIVVHPNNWIMNGNSSVRASDLAKSRDFKPIELAPMNFEVLHDNIGIDPYVLGIILTFGDYTQYEVAIPNMFTLPIKENLMNAGFILEPAHKTGYMGLVSITRPTYLIPWHQLFPFYIQHGFYTMNNYPDSIICMNLQKRMRFIHGVIDVHGQYLSELNTIVVDWHDYMSLIRFRNLLRSVGIVSCVEALKGYTNEHNLLYRLRIMWDYVEDRVLFSDPMFVAEYLKCRQKYQHVTNHLAKLQITDVKITNMNLLPNKMVFYTPRFKDPMTKYVCDDFLPHVSY